MFRKNVVHFLIFVIAAAIVYGSWKFQRWFHYSVGYEVKVEQTVCDMVKHEYLADPQKCKE